MVYYEERWEDGFRVIDDWQEEPETLEDGDQLILEEMPFDRWDAVRNCFLHATGQAEYHDGAWHNTYYDVDGTVIF